VPRPVERQAALTKRFCEELAPGARRYRVRDVRAAGLAFVVEPGGRKWWTVRYVTAAGKNTEKALGDWPGLLPEAARDAAAALRVQVRQSGADPAEERRAVRRAAALAAEKTLAALTEAYFAAARQGYGARGRAKAATTLAKEEMAWRTNVRDAFGERPFDQLRRAEIVEHIANVASERGPGAANSALEVLRLVYGYALDRELLQTSPVERIRPRVLAPRDRVATEQELGVIWRALSEIVVAGESLPERLPGQSHRQRTGAIKPRSNGVASARALQLAILTLQRRGEITSIHARDIDWDQRIWTIPALNKKERRIGKTPLSARAVTVLREAFSASGCDWPFANAGGDGPMDPHVLTRRFERLVGELELRPLSVHDLRRTGRTMLTGERLGIDEMTAERVLNHVVGSAQQRAYDWNAYLPQKRRALDLWADEVERLGGAA